MANTINKYVWLINLLQSRRRVTQAELNDAWRESGLADERQKEKGLSRKTLYNWRQDIAASLGVLIECETKGRAYEYYLDYSDDTKRMVREWLISTYTVCNELASNREISNRIVLEEVPSGQGYFSAIVNAMKQNLVLEITYRGFGKTQETSFLVEPYFVKLFHRRWYLIANNPYYNAKDYRHSIRIYGLDRVMNVKVTEEKFEFPEDFDPQRYLDDFYGADKWTDYDEVQKVKIKCSKKQSYYWETLRVHESQRKVDTLPSGEVIYQMELFPTYDFLQFLLSQGKEIEVLEPKRFRDEVAWHAREMSKTYDNKEQ